MPTQTIPVAAQNWKYEITPRGSDLDHLRWMEARGWLDNLKGKSVFDLGCGSGFVCQSLAARGASATGLDIVPIKADLPLDWKFLIADLDSKDWLNTIGYETASNRAHLVLSFDIIEHLRSPMDFLVQARQLLLPGGRIVLTTPNVNSWERVLRPDSWSGCQDPQHLVLFTRYSLQFLLQKAGFVSVAIEAPIRSLESLPRFLSPHWGAQLLATAISPLV